MLDDHFKKTERLVKLLKDKPCLIVLDNVETVLKARQAKQAGYFSDDCVEYAWLFQQLVENEHQSKVVFTSRETLAELQRRETYTFQLGGLDKESAIQLLQSFALSASLEELEELAERYDGHPKALEIVSAIIEQDFQGQVGRFLKDRKWLLVRDLESLIDEVVHRLSDEEYTCLSQISVYQTPEYSLSYEGIAAQMQEMSERELKENVVLALRRRQLLDFNSEQETYQMHPLVQEKASYLLASESYLQAHRQAYRYFLDIVKPEAEWLEFDDIKPLLRIHYHAYQARDWDEAAKAVLDVYEYLRRVSYFDLLVDLYSELLPENWQNGEQLVSCPRIHCDLLCNLGYAHFYTRNNEAADACLKQSLLRAC